MARQGRIRLVERGNYELFASEALRVLYSYDIRNRRGRRRIISEQPSLQATTTSSSSLSTTTTNSPVLSESKKKSAATLSVLKLKEEKQEYRSEILQSWEDVAHKVVKALSELI